MWGGMGVCVSLALMVKEMLDKDLRLARYGPSPVSEHRWGQTVKINLWLIFEMEDGGMKVQRRSSREVRCR